jgi:anthranilate synthase component 2
VQYLGVLGQQVKVIRNDALDVAGIRALHPAHIMISPGPGTPDDSGVSLDVLRELSGEIPIFGVCLGHQALGQVFGGKVVRARQIMHGKTSPVHHRGQGGFAGLPNPFDATRYHSLVVEKASVPDCLEVTAWTQHADGSVDEIMGLRHRTLAVEGVQFHPESILTEHGYNLLRNFLGLPLQLAA